MSQRSRKLKNHILRQQLAMMAASAGLGGLLLSADLAHADDWPRFRKGIWQFERTLSYNGSNVKAANRVLFKQEMQRCVDPSEAMRETFRPVSVGNCHSTRAERVANKYVFALRCDYMGPVRTTIDVESETAYIEINEVQVGQNPRTDTVIARRIAECD